ncbi:MAG: PLP-dependent aminotransferase family protein, partial [Chloroflexota bacterium]|nr:PLP-dependent aminotransferase family protein [Chloroflexota bacterium]
HVRRMRALYAERQAGLVEAARDELGDYLDVLSSDAGMHLLGWLPAGVDDRTVSQMAHDHGVVVPPLSRYAVTVQPRGALLLGYAAFTPRTIRSAARRLRGVLCEAMRSRGEG